ncbi:uncharacterized protein LACBIDRAFT_306265 [Laccaria bicolor S238N-H82]|uniref:Predicted protein n=2 Tax=Laccaria bicolor (strain S238N-H82 / ATCC MYA-4686) TaxID=486041 RepID=B0DMZ4_LACBS|nr:uncharacterized protein LACBIDRAFT_306265 [Laccaria bicolor S238N-H82]EDR03961.1 predicted protein [Laccaria bicolor S238N-H82]|eukprot:XP_001885216.1 predicted protein [Laccaria bicolor S238N-H82]
MTAPDFFQYTRDLARYFRGRLRSLHSPSVPHPAPPPWLEPEAQASVERVINMLEEAFKSSYTTTWDVRDYAADLSPRQSGSNEELEKKLLARFPPIYETAGSDIPYLDQPCHITDQQGHILLWYFPEMFSEQLRTFIWDHTGSLSPKKRSNGSWRDHHPENEGVTGIVNLSPSWFSQGHEGPEDPLRASADIQEPANSTYLQNVLLANAIVGAIYAVIQPDLFESSLATFEKLANHAEALDNPINIALRVWATPFTGLSVILNRETINHRDLKGYRESFDLLLTIRNYTGGRCHLAGLGFSLVYDPGTVVALAGNVLQHGVCPVLGDRACLAHFWHKKVGERLGVKRPQWLTMADLIYNLSGN